MKGTRQAEILRIISETEVETQEQLLDELAKRGIFATQATISRDIKELQLIKTLSSTGKYKYATAAGQQGLMTDRFSNIDRKSVV